MPDNHPYEDDWDDAPTESALPPRRRRRLVTPLSAALAAVLVAALGFIGGVQVQKHADKTTGSSSAQGALAAAATRGGGGAGTGVNGGFPGQGGSGAQTSPTVGSVANKHGSTLYVKDRDGNTVRVKTNSDSKISRTASTSAGAVHPGDTVIVQGTKHSDGSITATQVNATAAGATGGIAGLFGGGGFRRGLGGGGGGGQGAAPPGG